MGTDCDDPEDEEEDAPEVAEGEGGALGLAMEQSAPDHSDDDDRPEMSEKEERGKHDLNRKERRWSLNRAGLT